MLTSGPGPTPSSQPPVATSFTDTAPMPLSGTTSSMTPAPFSQPPTSGSLFSLSVPTNIAEIMGSGNMNNGLSTGPFLSPLPSGATAQAAGNGQVGPSSGRAPSPSASRPQSPGDDRHNIHGGKDHRGVGEIGAASGLFMLSQSQQESKPQLDDKASEAPKRSRKAPDDDPASAPQTKAQVLDHESDHDTRRDTSKASEKDENQSDETDNDSKRKSFLERNRQAAYKCRQRKKAWLASLQAKVEYLQSDNESLQSTVEALRAEVLFLKSQLMQHHQHESSSMSGERKEPPSEQGRGLPTSYPPMNINVTNGFVGYPTPANSSIMPNMPNAGQVPAHSSAPSMTSGVDNPMTNSLSAYAAHGMPRMTQLPASQPILSSYAHSPSNYPQGRDAD